MRFIRASRLKASACERRIRAVVVVLGIDPGTAHTGYSVVLSRGSQLAALDGGVIGTGTSEPLGQRLRRIHTRVCDRISERRADAIAGEDRDCGRTARSACRAGEARGVVMLA